MSQVEGVKRIEKNFSKFCEIFTKKIQQHKEINDHDLYEFTYMAVVLLNNKVVVNTREYKTLVYEIFAFWHYEFESIKDKRVSTSYIRVFQTIAMLTIQQEEENMINQAAKLLADKYSKNIAVIQQIHSNPGITFRELREELQISEEQLQEQIHQLKEDELVVWRREGEWQYYMLSKLGRYLIAEVLSEENKNENT